MIELFIVAVNMVQRKMNTFKLCKILLQMEYEEQEEDTLEFSVDSNEIMEVPPTLANVVK